MSIQFGSWRGWSAFVWVLWKIAKNSELSHQICQQVFSNLSNFPSLSIANQNIKQIFSKTLLDWIFLIIFHHVCQYFFKFTASDSSSISRVKLSFYLNLMGIVQHEIIRLTPSSPQATLTLFRGCVCQLDDAFDQYLQCSMVSLLRMLQL